MSCSLNLLCFFGIVAISFFDHAEARSPRILGGNFAAEGQFPYQISLERDGISVCGGSILTERFVVTVAHCVINRVDGRFKSQPKVVAGISNLVSRFRNRVAVDVAKAYVPKEYNPTGNVTVAPHAGDIAILELENELDLQHNPALGKVKLPENNGNNYEGKNAIVSGFGANEVTLLFNKSTGLYDVINQKRDNKLRFAIANVMSNAECQGRYSNFSRFAEKRLCAALVQRNPKIPEGVCGGDSGSGLIYNGIIIGVASTTTISCRTTLFPATYTRVSSYLSFINNVLSGKIDANIRTKTFVPASYFRKQR